MQNLQLHVTGHLSIEIDQFTTAEIIAQEGKVNVTFPSLAALYLFHRQFKRLQTLNLPQNNSITQLLQTVHVFYFIKNEPIGEMGPLVKGNWLTPYTGFKNLNLDAKALIRIFFSQLFNRN